MDVRSLQLSAQAIPNTEKKIREVVLEVKRRVRWEVCVGDPETGGGGGL